MDKQLGVKDLITIAISLIALLVPFYFFIVTSPEEIRIQTYIIFIGTLIVLIISVFIIYIYSRWMNLIRNVNNSKTQIQDIKRNLNLKDLFSSIDKRLIMLEMVARKKGKKAQIDPRVIVWIVLLILLILFLKSIGIF